MSRYCNRGSPSRDARSQLADQGRKVYLAKLCHTVPATEICRILLQEGNKCGYVTDVYVPRSKNLAPYADHRACPVHRGIAFVTFRTRDGARRFKDERTVIGRSVVIKKWALEKESLKRGPKFISSHGDHRYSSTHPSSPLAPRRKPSPVRSPSPQTLSRRRLNYPGSPRCAKSEKYQRLFVTGCNKHNAPDFGSKCEASSKRPSCSERSSGSSRRFEKRFETRFERMPERKFDDNAIPDQGRSNDRCLNSAKDSRATKCTNSEKDPRSSKLLGDSDKDVSKIMKNVSEAIRPTSRDREPPAEKKCKSVSDIVEDVLGVMPTRFKRVPKIPRSTSMPSKTPPKPSRGTSEGSNSVKRLRNRKHSTDPRSSHLFNSIPKLERVEHDGSGTSKAVATPSKACMKPPSVFGRGSQMRLKAASLLSRTSSAGSDKERIERKVSSKPKPSSITRRFAVKPEPIANSKEDTKTMGVDSSRPHLIGRKMKRKSLKPLETPGPRKIKKTKTEPVARAPARLKSVPTPQGISKQSQLPRRQRPLIDDFQTPKEQNKLLYSSFVPSSIVLPTPSQAASPGVEPPKAEPPKATHFFRAKYVQDGKTRMKSFASESRGHKNLDYMREAIDFAQGRYKHDITMWHSMLKYFDPERKEMRQKQWIMTDTSIPEGFRKAKADARLFRRTLK